MAARSHLSTRNVSRLHSKPPIGRRAVTRERPRRPSSRYTDSHLELEGTKPPAGEDPRRAMTSHASSTRARRARYDAGVAKQKTRFPVLGPTRGDTEAYKQRKQERVPVYQTEFGHPDDPDYLRVSPGLTYDQVSIRHFASKASNGYPIKVIARTNSRSRIPDVSGVQAEIVNNGVIHPAYRRQPSTTGPSIPSWSSLPNLQQQSANAPPSTSRNFGKRGVQPYKERTIVASKWGYHTRNRSPTFRCLVEAKEKLDSFVESRLEELRNEIAYYDIDPQDFKSNEDMLQYVTDCIGLGNKKFLHFSEGNEKVLLDISSEYKRVVKPSSKVSAGPSHLSINLVLPQVTHDEEDSLNSFVPNTGKNHQEKDELDVIPQVNLHERRAQKLKLMREKPLAIGHTTTDQFPFKEDQPKNTLRTPVVIGTTDHYSLREAHTGQLKSSAPKVPKASAVTLPSITIPYYPEDSIDKDTVERHHHTSYDSLASDDSDSKYPMSETRKHAEPRLPGYKAQSLAELMYERNREKMASQPDLSSIAHTVRVT